MTYDSAEGYIRGEYGEEIPVIKDILRRNCSANTGGLIISMDRLATEIVGYYTGCLRADGTPRVGRRPMQEPGMNIGGLS